MLQAILFWHVYEISGSALNLGLLGLVRFIPSLGTSMIGGAVADAYDRRLVMIMARSIPVTCATILAVATFGGWVSIELIFGLVVFLGFAMSFEGPARVALLPAIVRPETFENAVTVSNTLQKLAMVTGPTLAGVVIAVAGSGAGYGAFSIVSLISVIPLFMLRYQQNPASRRSVSVASIKEGILFVAKRQVLLGAMALDMFAVIFGGAQALLPIYAVDILHAGSTGYGVLQSSMQVGAFGMSAILVMRPPIHKTGRALIYTVVAYGLITVAFGFSHVYVLSVILYALIGACRPDQRCDAADDDPDGDTGRAARPRQLREPGVRRGVEPDRRHARRIRRRPRGGSGRSDLRGRQRRHRRGARRRPHRLADAAAVPL